ncbi:MAG TPA: class I SAM-dependent methyltransferase [Mycobacteriales bacterium]|nr:class I SAM-dependent methyltransferase [Mycobacteriales bacterium]
MFDVLVSLLDLDHRQVLDAGCGIGDLARPLAARVDRVDAVDPSAAMLHQGRAMPGGDSANLRWIRGGVEDAPLDPPYGLIVCGDSVHWFDWPVALPLFSRSLTAGGQLALVQRSWLNEPGLRELVVPIYQRHGANPDFEPRGPVQELERRALFHPVGQRSIGPLPWRPTMAALLDCLHSQNGFVIEKMADPDGFDREIANEVDRSAAKDASGAYELTMSVTITWGRPLSP